jgi:hypothetical protein
MRTVPIFWETQSAGHLERLSNREVQCLGKSHCKCGLFRKPHGLFTKTRLYEFDLWFIQYCNHNVLFESFNRNDISDIFIYAYLSSEQKMSTFQLKFYQTAYFNPIKLSKN